MLFLNKSFPNCIELMLGPYPSALNQSLTFVERLLSFRAHACLARPHRHRDPASPAGPPVGAPWLQPDPLPHLLPLPLLPLLHANRGQWREQRHRQRVPVVGSQHVPLHSAGPPAFSGCAREAGAGQSGGQEGEQRGHFPDRGGQ